MGVESTMARKDLLQIVRETERGVSWAFSHVTLPTNHPSEGCGGAVACALAREQEPEPIIGKKLGVEPWIHISSPTGHGAKGLGTRSGSHPLLAGPLGWSAIPAMIVG